MRVAVYLHPDHPHAGVDAEGNRAEEPVVLAFRLGRIEEGVHNAPIGHPAIPLDDFVKGLVAEARAEYPDAMDVRVERLIDNGDGTGRWIPDDEYNPDAHTAVGPGNIKSTEVHVTSEQSAGGGA